SRDSPHDASCRRSPPADFWAQDNDSPTDAVSPVVPSSFEEDQSQTKPISRPGRRGSLKCGSCRNARQGHSCSRPQEPSARNDLTTSNIICDAVIDILRYTNN